MSMSSIHVFDGGVIPDSESSGGSSGNANIKNLIMRDFDLNLEGETVSSKILCDYDSPQESTPYYAPVSIEDMAQWTKDGFNMQVRLEAQPSIAANFGFLARVSIAQGSTEDEVTNTKVLTYERLDDHRIKFNILNFDKVTDEVTSINYLRLSGMDEFTLDEDIYLTVDDIIAKIPSSASSSNKLVTDQQLENATASMASGYTPKGPASVSTLNGLTTQENGDQYIVTDSGTLTDGSLDVTAGESVAWDSVNEVWYKVNQYALRRFGTNEVHNLTTSVTAFRTGDVVPVDGPNGIAKMTAEKLLELTAQNALVGNIAQEFEPNRTSENPYKAGECVIHNGESCIFKVDHYGPWNASDVVSFGSVYYLIDALTNGIIPYNQRLNGKLGDDWSLLHSATTQNIDDYVSVTTANVDYSGIRNNSFLDYLGANKIKPGDKFHVSFYARLHTGDTATIKIYIGDSGSPQNKDIELTTSWAFYDFDLIYSLGEGDVLWLQFSTQSAQVLNFDIKGLRVYSNNSLLGSLKDLSIKDLSLALNFANEFYATKDYFKNQVVLKDNVLYQFMANHSAGVWNASDVRTFSIEKWFEGVMKHGLRLNGNLDSSWTAFNNATISVVNDYVKVVTAGQNYSGLRNNSWASWYSDYGAKVGDKFLLSFWARNEASEEKTIGLFVGDSSAPQNKQFVIDGEWRLYTFEFEYVVNNITFGRLQFGNQKTATSVTFNIKDVELYPLDSLFAKEKLLEKQQQDATPPHPLKGKKIAVIGDSISTIYGNNTPYWTVKAVDVGTTIQSYVTWYDVRAKVDGGGSVLTNKTIGGVLLTDAMIGTLQSFVPLIEDVGKEIGVAYNYNSSDTKVWSQVLAQKTGAELIANASWSGSSMCDGQAGSYAISHAFSPYTIGRCRVRDDAGNFVNPDVIFIYRGTNDMTHDQGGQGYSVLDDYDMMENGYPQTDVNGSGKYSFKRAYYMTIAAIRESYPKAMIYCCTLNVFKRVIYDRYPTRNGLYSLPMMNKVIREIAAEMGCGLVDFERDGITFENCYSEGYVTDSATAPTHPNNKGHEVMGRRAIADTNFVN